MASLDVDICILGLISTADVFLGYFLIHTYTNIHTGKTSIILFYFQISKESQSALLKKLVVYLTRRKNRQIIKINQYQGFLIVPNPFL